MSADRLLPASAVLCTLAWAADAQTPLTTELVAEGLLAPVHAAAPRGDDRVFVVEQGGLIRVAVDGVVLPTPFLDVTPKLSALLGESGLFGMAFHPDYANNGYCYVHYTDVNFDTTVERYTVSAGDPNVADPGSATLILFEDQTNAFHNGGGIEFGPDGNLYVAIGDGGVQGPDCPAQNLGNMLGTIVRIDVDSAFPYAIPPDNPFVGVPGVREEILHYGLRNPWRFTIDPVTKEMFIGDVGAFTYEELDYAPPAAKGLNFGWPAEEALHCFDFGFCGPTYATCGDPSFTPPILETSHIQPPFTCAIMAGVVYRGCAIPDLQGSFFFSDYCTGEFQSFEYDQALGITNLQDRTAELAPFFPQSQFVTSFGVDGRGEMLFVYHVSPEFDGKVYRVIPASPPAADCDLNGLDDACEIAADAVLDLDQNGVLDECQSLSADTFAVSIADGGTQNFALHAGLGFAGRLYVLAGSISGTTGIDLGGVTIPLHLDAYTHFGIVHPLTPPLFDNQGFLDSAGEASARFTSDPGVFSPSMIGLNVYHAYALVDPVLGVDFASNFVRFQFTP